MTPTLTKPRVPIRASSAGSSEFLSHAASPRFWLEAVCFVLLATPFELDIGSGYAYGIKTISLLMLLVPRLLEGGASIGTGLIWVIGLATSFLLVNALEISQRAIFAFILIVIGAALGQLRSPRWRGRFLALVNVYLIFHLLGFAIALLTFLLGGSVIDLHKVLFPVASRVHQIGLAARLSGFHNEPGTYAQWMLMVTFLRCMLMRKVISFVTAAVAVSALMTVSLWAIVGVSLISVAAALEVLSQSRLNRQLRTTLSALLLTSAAAAAFALLPGSVVGDAAAFLAAKAQMTTISGLDKLYAVRGLQQNLTSVIIVGRPLETRFCQVCLSPQDVGVWANATYYFGLLPTVALFGALGWIVTRRLGLALLPMLVVMLIWKAQFYDPLLWVMIGYILREHIPSRRPVGAARHRNPFSARVRTPQPSIQ